MTDLFEYASARRTDPLTSHAAAEAIYAQIPNLEAVVLRHLRSRSDGLTIDELVDITGIDKVTLSPRLRPLCKKGLAFESGATRPGKSGRQQTVWVARCESVL